MPPKRREPVVLEPARLGAGRANLLSVQFSETLVPVEGDRVIEVPIDDLQLEHQPREIVTDEVLARLIEEGRARPPVLLTCLQEIAQSDDYYRDILDGLQGLATSIASQGVYQPIEVVQRDERLIVRDGHRRCLAALLAGKKTIPVTIVSEADDLEAVARPFIVNVQRSDLTDLEKAATLRRLVVVVAQQLAAQQGQGAPTFEMMLDADAGTEATADSDGGGSRLVAGPTKQIAAEARARVCQMVGLGRDVYYRLLRLNRLTPSARRTGRRLTALQLDPIAGLPAEHQDTIVAFVVRYRLPVTETRTLARHVRRGEWDRVQEFMARLEGQVRRRQRVGASWEGLLHAVPQDVERRCSALAAELEALPSKPRRARLDQMREQLPRLRHLQAAFENLLARYDYGPEDGGSDGH